MKNLISKILLLNVIVLLLFSCKKEEDQAIAKATATSGTLAASQNTLVLTKANADQKAINFTIANPDYGFKAAVTNTLQIALKGTNFASPKEVTLDAKATTKEYTVIDFNALMLSMGLPTSVVSDVEARIVSTVSDAIAPVYSNVVAMKVTPYPLISFIYVPGAYQGWAPATAESLISATSNGIYEGIINFTPGNLEFKLLTKKSWGPPEYGNGTAPGSIAIGGGNLTAPAAGSYRVIADLNANTIAITPHIWSIIGDATPGDWSTDTEMTYNNGTRKWSLTTYLIGGKALKFRFNKSWAGNLGDNGNNGSLEIDGANIPVTTSGNYRIELDLVNNTYSLTML